jgi:hypothetical protein
MRTVFTVQAHGEDREFGNFEDAARFWDRATYLNPCDGGIVIQEWNAEGLMVRDGNLLHVHDGIVYINPSLEVRS